MVGKQSIRVVGAGGPVSRRDKIKDSPGGSGLENARLFTVARFKGHWIEAYSSYFFHREPLHHRVVHLHLDIPMETAQNLAL